MAKERYGYPRCHFRQLHHSDNADGDNNATFRVRVTNATGNVLSNPATLTVTPIQPPIPTIITPIVGTHFNYGDTISYSGSATDPEETTITNPAQFTWWVTYHTWRVERPFIPEFSGWTSGNFMLPTISPYTLPDVFYRVHLRVADGLKTTSSSETCYRTRRWSRSPRIPRGGHNCC